MSLVTRVSVPGSTLLRLARLLVVPALLVATAGCDYDRADYDTPTDPGSQFLVLEVVGGATTLPADGVSQLELRARISPDARSRTITFATSAGSLIGGSGSDAKSREVTADSSGVAAIGLRSAADLGVARITATVKDVPQVSQALEIAFVAPDPDALVRFIAAASSAPADGASASAFTVRVAPQVPQAERTVSFTTTAGSFVLGATTQMQAVPVNTDGSATVLLYSPTQVVDARVRATVAGASQEVGIRFTRALPDTILVSTSDATVAAGGTVTVTASLLRDVGSVTTGTLASFRARDDTGAPIGSFRSITTSTAAGGVEAVFSPGGTAYRGAVTITVEVEGRSGSAEVTVTD